MIKAGRFILPLILLCAATGFAQTNTDSYLRVIPSGLKLRATGVRFAGKPVERGDIYVDGPKLIYNGVAYYASNSSRAGLVAEDLKTGALTIYESVELALAAGWLKKRPSRKEMDEESRKLVRGYQRSGDIIWMGMDGLGVLAFDTKLKQWTRYDFDAPQRLGRAFAEIFYADEDYVFGRGFHVYSNNHKRWLKVDAVPTRYVRSYGYSGPYVQVSTDLTKYAREKYLPLGVYPEYLMLGYPSKVTLREDGEAYIFEFEPKAAPTEFTIEKWQLEWAFSQMTLNPAPEQSSK